jgi:hypothetical protein
MISIASIPPHPLRLMLTKVSLADSEFDEQCEGDIFPSVSSSEEIRLSERETTRVLGGQAGKRSTVLGVF